MSIAIVGGGITGLTAAYYLFKNNKSFQIFEATEKIGGLVSSFKEDNWNWWLEKYFHHYFTSDKEVRKLAKELDLEDKLLFKKVQTSLYYQGNIYPFDQPNDLLKFPYLDYFNKLRMGGVMLGLRNLPYLSFFDKFSAAGLFPKLIGSQSWQLIWQPLMKNKFGDIWDEVNFTWLWARLKKRSARLGYFQGGSEELILKLKELVEEKNKILTKTRIEKIKRENGQWYLYSQDKEFTAQKVILAMPMPAALKLIQTWKELDTDRVSRWRDLKNIGALTLVLRLKKKFLPGDTYWLNILEENFPFVVIVEQTNFFNSKHYGGENLIYVGGYYPKNNSIFNQDKKQVFKNFSPYLRRLNPSFENYLIDYRLFKYQNAQPIIPQNYSQLKPEIELIPQQLYWATSNHIFPWDRGVNYSIKLGEQVAGTVLSK